MTRSFFSTPASAFSKLALAGIVMILPLACGGGSDNNTPPAVAKPKITTQPMGQLLYETNPFSLSVIASGSGLKYQWMNGTTPISGATTATYAKASAATTDSGSITVVVSNDGGSVTSAAAILTVQALPDRAVAMPLISLDAPAYASSGRPATAVDDSGATLWQASGTSGWIALDLSGVRKDKIMFQWSNYYTWNYESGIMDYDKTTYNLIKDYTVDAHAAAGGAANLPAADDAGWVPLLATREIGNDYHSHQYLLDFTGYNWIRIHITAADSDPVLNMEVHDATAAGADDSWLIHGDSITAFAMGQREDDGHGNTYGHSLPQLINAGNTGSPNTIFTGNAAYYPCTENGGIGGFTTAMAVSKTINNGTTISPIDQWLDIFPGKYVTLALGTNDVNIDGFTTANLDAIMANFATLVSKIEAKGKVAVLPHMIWAPVANVMANGPLLNARIDQFYIDHPTVIHGPDLWAALEGRNDVFTGLSSGGGSVSSDRLHPDPAGIQIMREAWAKALLATVYRP